MKHIAILIAFLVTFSAPVAAQDFDKGLAAAQVGDFVTALQEWTPLAEVGNSQAQFNLGLMYNEGQGVLQDYTETVKWWRLAADQGHASAQYFLGIKYKYGQDVLQDNVMAYMWDAIASANGHDKADGYRVEGLMTAADAADILKSRAMARECMSSDYKIALNYDSDIIRIGSLIFS
mgnify:CR=1 FL=1